jgi:phosphoadenosine phosphosulfate reductase
MYKVTWDKETGGILLNQKVVYDALCSSPRPVFWEELNLLKLNELGWEYPHTFEPIMWAINKQYFYKGILIFEVRNANIYDAPLVVVQEGVKPQKLEPVNLNEMLERNREIMFVVESEAIEFIRDVYTNYASANKTAEKAKANQIDFETLAQNIEKKTKKKMAIVKENCDSFDLMPLEIAEKEGKRVFHTTKVDKFIASFSGGKDSQVVLDLCTRAIPSTEFEVIYSDTGYELPSSLVLYKEVQDYYKKKFPDLKFSTTKNHAPVLSYWDKIGTPSDTHRWCCSIMKTAPLYRSLKIEGTNKQAKVLTFDGVRAEESTRRADYDREGKGKHTTIYNAHPILYWNSTEIFLYLFRHHLTINMAYRMGKARVGCIVCPFSTTWDDMIVKKVYPEEMKPFEERLVSWAGDFGIKDTDKYIKDRRWKLKATGLKSALKTDVIFPSSSTSFIAEVKNARYPIYLWMDTVCDYTLNKSGATENGELKFNGAIYSFEVKYNKDRTNYKFTIYNCSDPKLIYYFKRVVNKSAFCVQCEVCEVDCPTGALSIYPNVYVDRTKCIRCHKCLESHDKGCIASDCIRMIKNTNNSSMNAKVQAYKTFGMREDWINDYLCDPAGFWDYNALGSAQVISFKSWLKDAEIIDAKNNLTPFGELLTSLYINDVNLTWELIFTNLTYNSFVVNWFTNNVNVGQGFEKKFLVDKIGEANTGAASATLSNAIGALIQLFNYSPIGETLCCGVEEGKSYRRMEYKDLTDAGLAYALYKFSEKTGIRSLRVADFYEPECEFGPHRAFGLSKSTFEKMLRNLNSSSTPVLIADLNMGLDNITLTEEDSTALDVVKRII